MLLEASFLQKHVLPRKILTWATELKMLKKGSHRTRNKRLFTGCSDATFPSAVLVIKAL